LRSAPGSDNALIANAFSPRAAGNPAAGGDADWGRGDEPRDGQANVENAHGVNRGGEFRVNINFCSCINFL
jgi:hypothetical protein